MNRKNGLKDLKSGLRSGLRTSFVPMGVCCITLGFVAGGARAQDATGTFVGVVSADPVGTSAVLPNAPGFSSSVAAVSDAVPAVSFDPQTAPGTPRRAGRYDTVISTGQKADKLSARDKFVFGFKDAISPFSLVGWVVSAGYEQAVDGSPNYGVVPGGTRSGKSFAQRLGAAAARSTSETVFSESILAPILHEDPRYYQQANHGFIYRVGYAATRPIFTRTDGGRTTINFSSLGGNLAGSALAQTYYPPINQGFSETMKTFAGSVGGSALGDLASEFLPGILQAVHLKKKN